MATYYHAAPAGAHDTIMAEGINAQDARWYNPIGNYLWDDYEAAKDWANYWGTDSGHASEKEAKPHMIYEVEIEDAPEPDVYMHGDPNWMRWHDNAFRLDRPIRPEEIKAVHYSDWTNETIPWGESPTYTDDEEIGPNPWGEADTIQLSSPFDKWRKASKTASVRVSVDVEREALRKIGSWSDVRDKAVDIRRSGNVVVSRHDDEVIAATVESTTSGNRYDVVLYRQANNSGAISSWECACEWGQWAFKRQHTFVGRLCSHAYATLLWAQSREMFRQGSYQWEPPEMYDECPNCGSDKFDFTVNDLAACDDCGEQFHPDVSGPPYEGEPLDKLYTVTAAPPETILS
jgi:hypothetical protein